MFHLTKKLEYSLLAFSYMAQLLPESRWVTAKEISDHYQIPYEVVARCLQHLARAGVLHSWIGAQGGYRLKAGWEKKSLLELYEILEGPMNLVRCLDHDGDCSHVARCTLPVLMRPLNQKLKKFFQDLVLRDVLNLKEVINESKVTTPS
ncbi:MAG: Rrf2 family transcriptional regulator [Bdellovibrionaceae bacterium]|nr:Rrf2 family transcriptional regulator [Pseudobdellovibrionaceae bacterium]MDW8191297.1 Rrf2 family transcriptional regulator [Pseudobdellovibrionaceae bacterium]